MPRDGSATRDRLLAAASALFVSQPVAAVSLRQITTLAGAGNTAAIHQHFGSRAGLEAALVAKVQPALNATRARALPTHPPSRLADAASLRPTVAALVDPVATLLDGPFGPGVLRLTAHALIDEPLGAGSRPWLVGTLGTDEPSTRAAMDAIASAHPFGESVWALQQAPLLRVLWTELSHRAVCEAAPRAGARAPMVAGLIDALVAPLVVAPSDEFLRAAGFDPPVASSAPDAGGVDNDDDVDTGGLADRFREATQNIRRPTMPTMPSLTGRATRPGRSSRTPRSSAARHPPSETD